MSTYAPVDDMDGKTPAEVLRELAWTRRQRNDLIRDRDGHAKARGEAEHRRSKAERALDDARRSFKGALKAMGALPRTIATAEELDALPESSVVLSGGVVPRIKASENRWLGDGIDVDSEHIIEWTNCATVLYEPGAE